MADVKITKKMVLEAILQAVDTISEDTTFEVDGIEVSLDDIADYAEKTIAQLDAKAVKAKETAAKKKAENDELLDAVKAVLTEDYQTGTDIFNAVDVEGATQAKVTARLTKLCKAGEAHKVDVKTEDGRKVKGYALGEAPAEDAE